MSGRTAIVLGRSEGTAAQDRTFRAGDVVEEFVGPFPFESGSGAVLLPAHSQGLRARGTASERSRRLGVTSPAEVFGQPSKDMYEAGKVFGRFKMGVTGRAEVFGQPSKAMYEAGKVFGRFKMGVTGRAEVFGQASKAVYEACKVFGRFKMGVTGRAEVFGQPSKAVYEARLGNFGSPNGECEASRWF